jgi:ribonuclease HI
VSSINKQFSLSLCITKTVPNKVKSFIWRAYYNAIPTASGLYRRKIIQSPKCNICSGPWETVGHILIHCKFAKEIWRTSTIKLSFKSLYNLNFDDIIHSVHSSLNKKDFSLFLCISWSIWTARNKRIFENIKKDPYQITSWTSNFLLEFQSAQSKRSSSVSLPSDPDPKQDRSQARWVPPSCDLYKFIVDASIPKSSNFVGVGAVIRNSSGLVMAALAQNLPGKFTVKEAEALALRYGLSWALEVFLPIHFVESDAKTVVQALERKSSFKNEFGSILSDVSSLLSNFPRVKLSHIYREANMAAHGLATYALSIDDKLV